MNRNNNKQEKNGMNKPAAYNEADVTDTSAEEVVRLIRKLLPYQRPIMIVGMIILIMLVVFLGFSYGGLTVCNDLDGLLDSKFKCHPNYYKELEQRNIDAIRQPFVFPSIVENES